MATLWYSSNRHGKPCCRNPKPPCNGNQNLCAVNTFLGQSEYKHFIETQSIQFHYQIQTHVWPRNYLIDQGEQNKIDALQMKCIRRIILKIPPTFIDRSQTNQFVRDQATRYGVNIEKFSETWRQQKWKLLGHILRASREYSLRHILFEYGSNILRISNKKMQTTKTRLV